MGLQRLDKHMNVVNFIFPGDYIQKTLLNVDKKVLSGGKNLRSKLMRAFGVDLGVDLDVLNKLVEIGELVHNATLAHDDVIDEGKIRRGVDSLPVQIGNRESVLAGDYMLARAMYELSQYNNPKLIQELAQILKDLVDGELLQLACIENKQFSLEEWSLISRKKTGSLISWAFLAPSIISEHDLDLNLLKHAANILGEAYQILDDSIDVGLVYEHKSTYTDKHNHLENFIDLNFKYNDQITSSERLIVIEKIIDDKTRQVLNILALIEKSHNLHLRSTTNSLKHFLERSL
jgi:geranylgeranyl pyrophosphate synthase